MLDKPLNVGSMPRPWNIYKGYVREKRSSQVDYSFLFGFTGKDVRHESVEYLDGMFVILLM